jgi:CheY-like chemotaxis protein
MPMSEEAGVQRATIPLSVLVVEDEESTRKLCADVAESCGMKTLVAGTVEDALRRLEMHAPVVVIGEAEHQKELSGLVPPEPRITWCAPADA